MTSSTADPQKSRGQKCSPALFLVMAGIMVAALLAFLLLGPISHLGSPKMVPASTPSQQGKTGGL